MANKTPDLQAFIEAESLKMASDALIAISKALNSRFDDPAYLSTLAQHAGKARLSESALNSLAEDHKERAMAHIARIFNEDYSW